MDHMVYHSIAEAKFIVKPGNELDRVVTEGNASPPASKVEEYMSLLKSQETTSV